MDAVGLLRPHRNLQQTAACCWMQSTWYSDGPKSALLSLRAELLLRLRSRRKASHSANACTSDEVQVALVLQNRACRGEKGSLEPDTAAGKHISGQIMKIEVVIFRKASPP